MNGVSRGAQYGRVSESLRDSYRYGDRARTYVHTSRGFRSEWCISRRVF